MQMTMAEIMRIKNAEQKEAFYAKLEANYQRLLKHMIKELRETDPKNAARVFPETPN